MTERRLLVLRHAKSDWPEGVADHDRPLGKRGRRDAPNVGQWMATNGYLPDVVVCSTAQRTRQTWELIAAKLPSVPEVTFDPRAYGASAQTLLYLARELPDEFRTALLIGHNPGVSEFAGIGFPTAGIAVLEFDGDWPEFAPDQAHRAAFAIPAEIARKM
ncbi:MAG TPA: histidine phosphatase family protein [Streptosporangiaceae bacterium]